MQAGHVHLQQHSFTEPVRKVPRYIKDLPWLLVSIQAALLVVFILALFAYAVSAPEKPDPTTTTVTSTTYDELGPETRIFRKLPKFTESPKYVEEIKLQPIEVDLGFTDASATIDWGDPEPAPEPLRAGVFSDHPDCSQLGRSILLRGGNAADAAVSVSLCLSLSHPQRGGMGGGLVATVAGEGACTVLNARESAPSSAISSYFSSRRDETVVGAKACGTPGYLHGLFRLNQRFSSGKLSWKQLVDPVIDMCRKGVAVSGELAADLVEHESLILNDQAMRSLFTDPITRKLLKEGELMRNEGLADTLREMSEYEDVADYFYNGGTGFAVVKELRQMGGILTVADLEDYESEFSAGLLSSLRNGEILCGPRPPSAYAALQLAIRAMEYPNSTLSSVVDLVWDDIPSLSDPIFSPSSERKENEMTTHDAVEKLIRRMKEEEGESKRQESSAQQERGSSSVLVVDEKGMGVAVTASIGDLFGSRVLSRLGFFLNNALGAFEPTNDKNPLKTDDHPNSLQPGKCPITLASTVIGIKKNEVSFLASGTDFRSLVESIHRATSSKGAELEDQGAEPLLAVIQKDEEGTVLRNADQSLLAGY